MSTKILKEPNVFTTRNIIIEPNGVIKLHLVNSYPINNGDRIDISGSNKVFYGSKIDTSILLYPFAGNKKNYYWWVVTKNGVTKNFSDSIFIKSTDTVNYRILY